MTVARTRGDNGGGEAAVSEMVRLVRATYSETMDAGDARGLARLERALHASRVPERMRPGRLMMILALSAVVLTAGGTVVYRRFERVTYEVMNGAVGPGGFVRTTAPGTTILFSEGSEITLGDSARTRVDDLTADGGRVVVESGSVHARIVPRKHAHWFVDAGPYTIRVTGTAFNVKWSWAEQRLDLRMDRGSVVVTGPLAPAGVTLTAGMKLVANPESGLAIVGGSGTAAAVAGHHSGTAGAAKFGNSGESPASGLSGLSGLSESPEEAADAPQEDPADIGAAHEQQPSERLSVDGAWAKEGSAPRSKRASAHGGVAPGSRRDGTARHLALSEVTTATPHGRIAGEAGGTEPWERQLARGNVKGILDDAAARGIDRVLVSASGQELSALADAARYGHEPVLAHRVLLSVRERFPQSAESRDAAFFLGGLAEDALGTGGPAAALDWYERYLAESGHGRYAAQALGRKMVITQKLKGIDAARPVANDYLERFPGGPYAPAARKVIRTP